LISNTVANASYFLHHLENAAKDVGLHVNALKTEPINFNQQLRLKTLSDVEIKAVQSFT